MTSRILIVTSMMMSVVLSNAPAIAASPPVTRHVLSNGMVVLIREHRAAGVVAVSLMARGGTAVETERTAGITNFLHRVMIRGTRKLNAAQVAEATEEIGGRIDAAGDVDVAEVQGQALARHWDTLLSLVAAVVLEPTFAAEQIEQERRLILAQIQTRADTPFPLAMDTLTADLYGAHPYALPPAGRKTSLEHVTRDLLIAHHREAYRADRLVLAVSGDVRADRVIRRVERLFGTLAAGETGTRVSAPAPTPTRDRRVVERPLQQAQIVIGYLAPRLSDPDYPAVKVLGAVLGGGLGGRLFVELREQRGLAYSLGVVNASRKGPAAFVSYLRTSPRNVAEAEESVLREIDRVKAEPPSEDDLARAKAYVLGNLAMDRRTNARQAWYLAFFESVGAGWDFPERYARDVEGVTAVDVQAVARKYLSRPTTVILRPPPQ